MTGLMLTGRCHAQINANDKVIASHRRTVETMSIAANMLTGLIITQRRFRLEQGLGDGSCSLLYDPETEWVPFNDMSQRIGEACIRNNGRLHHRPSTSFIKENPKDLEFLLRTCRRSIGPKVTPSYTTIIMLSNTSLAGVLASAIIGTVIVVIVLLQIWTTWRRRYFTNNNSRSAEFSRTIPRADDADLGITPYDFETEILADLGDDFDRQLTVDLHVLFRKIDHCANTHFRGGTQTLENDLGTEELLRESVIAECQGQGGADDPLGAQRLVSLLRDPKQRNYAAHHFIISSICAALDIEGNNGQRSLVPADYMSFVKSIKATGDSQCTLHLLSVSSAFVDHVSSLGLSFLKDSINEGDLD